MLNYPCKRLPPLPLVRPHLGYAMQDCSSNLVADADSLEQIKWLAMRLGVRQLPYEERLRRLSLHSFNRRRLRGDLIAAYDVLSGRLDLGASLFFTPPVRPNLKIIHTKFCRVLVGTFAEISSSSIRVIKFWRRFPTSIGTAPHQLI